MMESPLLIIAMFGDGFVYADCSFVVVCEEVGDCSSIVVCNSHDDIHKVKAFYRNYSGDRGQGWDCI